MKKKFSTGFSLAEILITLGIISVVATLGFTISKKGIERAYDSYIYTGVAGISNAISNANAVNLDINISEEAFLRHIRSLLEDRRNIQARNDRTIIAPNRIRYMFNKLGNTDTGSIYQIIMIVPTRDGNNNNRYTLFYLADSTNNMIIPNAPLDTRMDLLPYYIDNGRTGRVLNNRYNRIRYNSFKNSYCSANGTLNVLYTDENRRGIYTYDCEGIAQNQTGAIVLVNPRKLRPF